MCLKDFDSLKQKLRAFKVLVPDADQKVRYERAASQQQFLDMQKQEAAQKDLLAINLAKMPKEHLEQLVTPLFNGTKTRVKTVSVGGKTYYYHPVTAKRLKKSEVANHDGVLSVK